jgi:RNA polymerase sigma-70 factor, ECF subfamily
MRRKTRAALQPVAAICEFLFVDPGLRTDRNGWDWAEVRRLAIRVALARLRDPDAADEVAQEVLLRTWRAAPRVERIRSPEAWIVTVAGNEVLRYVQRRQRRAGRETALFEDEEVPDAAAPHRLRRVEQRCALAAALRGLSPLDRTILGLHYFGDLPLPAIASQLDMPLGTVKARISRARARLRRELNHEADY